MTQESLLRILLMLEIFVHWVESSLSRTEWRGVAKPKKKKSNETMDVPMALGKCSVT